MIVSLTLIFSVTTVLAALCWLVTRSSEPSGTYDSQATTDEKDINDHVQTEDMHEVVNQHEQYVVQPDYAQAKLKNIATLLASNSCSKLPYKALLKDARWLSKRLEILRRDDFTCKTCGFRNDLGMHLQVHHLRYSTDAATGQRCVPWDYDNDDLVTLCE